MSKFSGGEVSVSEPPSKLERRARALLRAYPVEYRRDRGEEIIGTLLELAPPGRTFPPLRESCSLLMGGRRARAARNHSLGLAANLRLSLILAISIYLPLSRTFAVAFMGAMGAVPMCRG
jgi:hypothetical protein